MAALKASRAIEQSLADANPAVTEFQIVLANAHLETGDVLRLIGQSAEARASYEAAPAIIERLIKAQPAFADPLQIYLVFGLKGLGATQQTARQTALAVVSWRRAIATDKRTRSSDGETLYALAGCHSRLGGISGAAGSGLSTAEDVFELDRAMGVLRRSIAAGYHKVAWMKRDPDLDPLRAGRLPGADGGPCVPVRSVLAGPLKAPAADPQCPTGPKPIASFLTEDAIHGPSQDGPRHAGVRGDDGEDREGHALRRRRKDAYWRGKVSHYSASRFPAGG